MCIRDRDVEVSRLTLMKADHQSKQYRLEDQLLKYFPEEIEKHRDSVSKKLFEALTAEEEVHQDQFDTEMENLQKFGDHYLVLQSVERSKSVAIGTRRNVL